MQQRVVAIEEAVAVGIAVPPHIVARCQPGQPLADAGDGAASLLVRWASKPGRRLGYCCAGLVLNVGGMCPAASPARVAGCGSIGFEIGLFKASLTASSTLKRRVAGVSRALAHAVAATPPPGAAAARSCRVGPSCQLGQTRASARAFARPNLPFQASSNNG